MKWSRSGVAPAFPITVFLQLDLQDMPKASASIQREIEQLHATVLRELLHQQFWTSQWVNLGLGTLPAGSLMPKVGYQAAHLYVAHPELTEGALAAQVMTQTVRSTLQTLCPERLTRGSAEIARPELQLFNEQAPPTYSWWVAIPRTALSSGEIDGVTQKLASNGFIATRRYFGPDASVLVGYTSRVFPDDIQARRCLNDAASYAQKPLSQVDPCRDLSAPSHLRRGNFAPPTDLVSHCRTDLPLTGAAGYRRRMMAASPCGHERGPFKPHA